MRRGWKRKMETGKIKLVAADMDGTLLNRERNISLQNIEKIANGLNITISELFEGIGGNCND